jgi:hypothetical protein
MKPITKGSAKLGILVLVKASFVYRKESRDRALECLRPQNLEQRHKSDLDVKVWEVANHCVDRKGPSRVSLSNEIVDLV